LNRRRRLPHRGFQRHDAVECLDRIVVLHADSKAEYAAYMANLPEETRAELDALAGRAKAAMSRVAGS
jgi:hypothetical protein